MKTTWIALLAGGVLMHSFAFADSVPEGRLNLAQDASPGYITQHD
jgi:hypothetical protein